MYAAAVAAPYIFVLLTRNKSLVLIDPRIEFVELTGFLFRFSRCHLFAQIDIFYLYMLLIVVVNGTQNGGGDGRGWREVGWLSRITYYI